MLLRKESERHEEQRGLGGGEVQGRGRERERETKKEIRKDNVRESWGFKEKSQRAEKLYNMMMLAAPRILQDLRTTPRARWKVTTLELPVHPVLSMPKRMQGVDLHLSQHPALQKGLGSFFRPAFGWQMSWKFGLVSAPNYLSELNTVSGG